MSLPALAAARPGGAAEAAPGAAPQQQGGAAAQNVIPAWRPGDADSFTRYYFDSLMLEARYLDSDIPSTKLELFGETFDTPIMTAALSHLNNPQGGMIIYAKAAAACKAVHEVLGTPIDRICVTISEHENWGALGDFRDIYFAE